MISNNKILTVSYGTFSCTLEGFDDSFGTMKAIAEYFRDLASDDRYFGAEPPVPDAEMLARIAEREIERRVQAHMSDGRIVLSAAPNPAMSQDTQEADQEVADVSDAEATVATAATDDTPEAEASTPAPDAIAIGPDSPHDEIDDAFDTADLGDMAAAVSEQAPQVAAADPVIDAVDAETTDALDNAEGFFAASPADTGAVEDEDEDAPDARRTSAVAPHADSIAAKLDRIRAVVSKAREDDDAEDAYLEDEHAEDMVSDAVMVADDDAVDAVKADDGADIAPSDAEEDADAQADVVAAAAADVTAALDADEDEMDRAKVDEEEDDDDDISAILARLDADDKASQEEDAAADHVTAPDEIDDADAEIDGGAEAEIDAGMGDDMDNEDDASANLFEADEDATTQEPATEQAAAAPRVARVVKVKRADLEAAIADGSLEEMNGGDDAADNAAQSSLSAEDEDELMRELAEVEAEPRGDAVASDDDYDGEDDDVPTAAGARSEHTDDSDVDRLMAKADVEMDEPESARNRDAFAHLRAAVAARNSDTGIADGDDDAKEAQPYRTDLADVVKPRRPIASERRKDRDRPDTARPAPLKLVAEQRVGPGAAPKSDAGPVRPRRVAAAIVAPDDASDAGSFAEFADDMGAHGLPDLLEAAAAYLAFVEDRDQFSRPQLMTKVRQVVGADFSREDGLRSFGQLLRAGKIEKIKGGRFVATGEIGFRPDQRAAS